MNIKGATIGIFFVCLLLLGRPVLCAAQSAQGTEDQDSAVKTPAEAVQEGILSAKTAVLEQGVRPMVPGKLVFTLGAAGILNTDKQSAPSPVLFTVGAGAQFPVYTAKEVSVSVSPHGSYFAGYYLWDKINRRAAPAEIEQRTAYVPSLMLDVPAVFGFSRTASFFSAGLGVSFLLRFAARAVNVFDSASEIQAMNRWFWQNARFLYPSLHFSYDYIFPNGLAAGIGAKLYFSAGSLADKRGLDSSILILCIRVIPPKNFK